MAIQGAGNGNLANSINNFNTQQANSNANANAARNTNNGNGVNSNASNQASTSNNDTVDLSQAAVQAVSSEESSSSDTSSVSSQLQAIETDLSADTANMTVDGLQDVASDIQSVQDTVSESPMFTDDSLNQQLSTLLETAANSVEVADDSSDAMSTLRDGVSATLSSIDDQISDIPLSKDSVANGWKETSDALQNMRAEAQSLLDQIDADIAAGNTNNATFEQRVADANELISTMTSEADAKKVKSDVESLVDDNLNPALQAAISGAEQQAGAVDSVDVDTAAQAINDALALIADNEDLLVGAGNQTEESEAPTVSSSGGQGSESSGSTRTSSESNVTNEMRYAFERAKIKARMGAAYESQGAAMTQDLQQDKLTTESLGTVSLDSIAGGNAAPGMENLKASAERTSETLQEQQKAEVSADDMQQMAENVFGGEKPEASSLLKDDMQGARNALMKEEFSVDNMEKIYNKQKAAAETKAAAVMERMDRMSAELDQLMETATAAAASAAEASESLTGMASSVGGALAELGMMDSSGMKMTELDPKAAMESLASAQQTMQSAMDKFDAISKQMEATMANATEVMGDRLMTDDMAETLSSMSEQLQTTMGQMEEQLGSAMATTSEAVEAGKEAIAVIPQPVTTTISSGTEPSGSTLETTLRDPIAQLDSGKLDTGGFTQDEQLDSRDPATKENLQEPVLTSGESLDSDPVISDPLLMSDPLATQVPTASLEPAPSYLESGATQTADSEATTQSSTASEADNETVTADTESTSSLSDTLSGFDSTTFGDSVDQFQAAFEDLASQTWTDTSLTR